MTSAEADVAAVGKGNPTGHISRYTWVIRIFHTQWLKLFIGALKNQKEKKEEKDNQHKRKEAMAIAVGSNAKQPVANVPLIGTCHDMQN